MFWILVFKGLTFKPFTFLYDTAKFHYFSLQCLNEFHFYFPLNQILAIVLLESKVNFVVHGIIQAYETKQQCNVMD